MPKTKKLDLRPRYMGELRTFTTFHGYKVTESGVVYNSKGRMIKPKFYFKGKRIDYVYLDVKIDGKPRRISYHRFIYMAWNADFAEANDQSLVVTTVGRRFDYRLANLKIVPKQEHLMQLSKNRSCMGTNEQEEVVKTYLEVKDIMTKKEFALRLNISTKTLNKYIRSVTNGS
jgi:hypothetical protein